MLNLSGTIYILENLEASRLKIGVTINNPVERLKDVSRMWNGTKGICQVCSSRRLLLPDGRMPKHVLSGNRCYGSGALPIESDVTIASQELNKLRANLELKIGRAKGSAAKRVKSLECLIETYRNKPIKIGTWQICTSFVTGNAYRVEQLVHEQLSKYLDTSAPFGEVFTCSAAEAIIAIEKALVQVRNAD